MTKKLVLKANIYTGLVMAGFVVLYLAIILIPAVIGSIYGIIAYYVYHDTVPIACFTVLGVLGGIVPSVIITLLVIAFLHDKDLSDRYTSMSAFFIEYLKERDETNIKKEVVDSFDEWIHKR